MYPLTILLLSLTLAAAQEHAVTCDDHLPRGEKKEGSQSSASASDPAKKRKTNLKSNQQLVSTYNTTLFDDRDLYLHSPPPTSPDRLVWLSFLSVVC